jgi:hypothetical protein
MVQVVQARRKCDMASVDFWFAWRLRQEKPLLTESLAVMDILLLEDVEEGEYERRHAKID